MFSITKSSRFWEDVLFFRGKTTNYEHRSNAYGRVFARLCDKYFTKFWMQASFEHCKCLLFVMILFEGTKKRIFVLSNLLNMPNLTLVNSSEKKKNFFNLF